jgi:hypothetical protein
MVGVKGKVLVAVGDTVGVKVTVTVGVFVRVKV